MRFFCQALFSVVGLQAAAAAAAFALGQQTGWGLRDPAVASRAPRRLHNAAAEESRASETGGAIAGESHDPEEPTAVRAPLGYAGPYPTLSLRFPSLSTSSQRSRNATGVSLDFVLDTAANTNTINAQVASELALEVVGAALPGVGAGGAISGGETYLLGDAELDGIPKEDRFTFMTGLTASALLVASPSAAGLLGVYFFNSFPGGVEFTWGESEGSVPPSVTFYGDPKDMGGALSGLGRVEIEQLPVSALPSVTLRINDEEIPALLDTGSPVTVLNAEAARLAGVDTVEVEGQKQSGWNPFSGLTKGLKTAQAAARGDVLMIAGTNGKPVELLKSRSKVGVAAGEVEIGQSYVYVGDLPGLAALGGLGGSSAPPAAVLGMDVLRLRPRMVYRPDEVFM